jgi:predicted RecB family nuclease
MQIHKTSVLYSASDLVNFTRCEHRTSLDMINLETPMEKAADSAELEFIQNRSFDHEHDYIKAMKTKTKSVVVIDAEDILTGENKLDGAAAATVAAMKDGADIIYQAALRDGYYYGYADFLRRVNRPSTLGAYSYEVIDTKLARTSKPAHIIQLCFYSELLSRIQGCDPEFFSLVLGDKREERLRYADFSKYFASIKERFEEKIQRKDTATYPEPCDLCDICVWRIICANRWIEDDHLCQTANITKIQINKLRDAGIDTLAALARLPADAIITKMAPDTFKKIRHQAWLQLKKRETGKDMYELLPPDPQGIRGFARLPEPDAGDLFFDMEGDPLEPGGLEYLFGIYYKSGKSFKFKAFWGHDRAGEKKAFEDFMDFVANHLKKYPNAHVYHYANYEEAALKRLMCIHGTKEAEVDNLLRNRKLVDLYKVVREGIRVSEPSYSIKNLEVFYMPNARAGDVKNGMASVAFYEKWRQEKDDGLLKQIADYNEDDCRSTYLLREWLLSLRPPETPWFNPQQNDAAIGAQEEVLTEAEKLLIPYRKALIDPLPENRGDWEEKDYLNELVYFLADFHRREDKPGYWAFFTRIEMTDDEAVEDPECLGALRADKSNPPVVDKRSYIYTYTIPEQDSKITTGANCVRVGVASSDPLNNLEIDEEYATAKFRYAMKRAALPDIISIGPSGPLNNKNLRAALRRFAESYIAGDGRYKAVSDLLQRNMPGIKGVRKGDPIVDESEDILQQTINRIENLSQSCISIQGPPGSGKTHTGSHVIVSLLKKGFRVGVTSNSHKVIHNLLYKVEEVAGKDGFIFSGAKKSNKDNEDSLFNGRMIEDVFDYDDIENGGHQLVAGTAWLYSRMGMDRLLDYLIVDEAGQVSLGNLAAMGTSAKNIVLLGDQMQLGQPVQGVHPGDSGLSTLDYLLQGKATVPPEMGIFLPKTWRMHPDVCGFISDAVYDGRLKPKAENKNQRLILQPGHHSILKPAGIAYLAVDHDGNSQSSDEEAEVVKTVYKNLLKQRYADKSGNYQAMGHDNILVVAPYNMQVNLLKKILPAHARVGTVDKFQGQEAEVVMVSMATSSEEYLPRYIEFLYSRNRLNVALSRARCLSILVANPRLMAIKCKALEQMKLVNTLCWVKNYSEQFQKQNH